MSNAGGLGSLAAGYLGAEQIREQIHAVRALTNRPFAVNIFAPHESVVTPEQLAAAGQVIEPYRAELDLPPRVEPAATVELGTQLDAILESPPGAVSFTFGLLPDEVMTRLTDAGCLVIGTATTVAEAVALAESGADMVCAQGAEAGAHRGSFLDGAESLVGTIALVPQICDAIATPVIAAGGIMDARGVLAVLALGAGAAQLGTAFLRCPEAGTAAAHREALAASSDTSTSVTAAVTGKSARGITNRLMNALDGHAMPPYPHTHWLTAELRRRAAQLGRADLMALWAGQGAPLGTDLPAAEVVATIADGLEQGLAGLDRPAVADAGDETTAAPERSGDTMSKIVTWSDPQRSWTAARGMSGLEYLEAMRSGQLPPPPITRLLGYTLQDIGDGEVTLRCRPDASTYNALGAVHGGVACTLLDSATASAVQTQLPRGSSLTSMEMKVSWLRPVTPTPEGLTAYGRVVQLGARVAFAEGTLQDHDGRVLATASSTCLILAGERQ